MARLKCGTRVLWKSWDCKCTQLWQNCTSLVKCFRVFYIFLFAAVFLCFMIYVHTLFCFFADSFYSLMPVYHICKIQSKLHRQTHNNLLLEQTSQANLWFVTWFSDADKTAASTSAGPSLSNMTGARSKELPSFWIPSLTPAAAATKVDKPVGLLAFFSCCLKLN